MKRNEHMIPMWSRLVIELNSDCNRNCDFCPRYNDYSGIRKDKKFEAFGFIPFHSIKRINNGNGIKI